MKTAFRKTVILSFLFFCLLPVYSQILSKKGLIKAIQEADIFYYYDQDYEQAARLYESLLKSYPENANLTAKLGICYLNLDGKNPEALKLLTKALLKVAGNDKEFLEYGDKAPLDTYLYLAIAYHQNDSLQRAIALYTDAKKRLSRTKAFREEYIDNQIKDCRYAMEMKKKPLMLKTDLFTKWLGDYPGASNPVLSKNDSVFIFTQKENGKTRILCSYKSGTWKTPVDITKQLGGDDKMYSNSITGDGNLLIIYLDDGGNGNIYYSERKDSVWSKIKSIGKPICSIYWQSHAFITPNGKAMYFSSNRPGGEGELDIWYSEKTMGRWSDPVNCGNIINSPYNEDTPFFDTENNTLLFSSVGHISMGGYDVFRSLKKNTTWTIPVGIPYAFNNTLGNTFFILNNNKPGFITSLYDEKRKVRNIYTLVAENPIDKITTGRGTITLEDGMEPDPKLTRIWYVDLRTPDVSKEIDLLDSASFKFDITPGDYQLYVSHTGYKTDTVNLSIPLYFSGNYIPVNASLIPDKVTEGKFLSINNVLFDFNSSILNNEAKSELDILKSVLISYPELKVEVAGYTDAIGNKVTNQKLADKRAQTVISYLTTDISNERFVKKAFGKSEFIAVNTNRDGSDNPEGRKLNRRVTFGIIDSKTGTIIRQESYTPEHLRQQFSMRYNIILEKSREKLKPEHFSKLTIDGLLFIRNIETDSISMYSLGVFYNKIEALKYLEYARGKGFVNAYILNQYDLDKESSAYSQADDQKAAYDRIDQKIFTIQLKATRNPLDINRIFSGFKGVKEIKASDGFFKYYYGEYEDQTKAREALPAIKKAGFEDAFIRNLYLLLTQY